MGCSLVHKHLLIQRLLAAEEYACAVCTPRQGLHKRKGRLGGKSFTYCDQGAGEGNDDAKAGVQKRGKSMVDFNGFSRRG